LELLAGEMVRLTEHQTLSRETVRRRLSENELKPWRQTMWCIPRVDANTWPVWKTSLADRHRFISLSGSGLGLLTDIATSGKVLLIS
jgi:hypothetical protein